MNKIAILGLMLIAFATGALIGPASAPNASTAITTAQGVLTTATILSVIVLLIWGLYDFFAGRLSGSE